MAPFTDEHRARIAAALRGHVVSPATRAKLSAKQAANRGWRHSEETRAKMSASAKGRVMSVEARAKLAASRRGKPLSDETKAKLSRALRGIQRSPEYRAKMAASTSRRLDHGGALTIRPGNRYTKLAQHLHAHLVAQGLTLEPEVRFGRFTVDLYDRQNHVAYEADGRYWHERNEAARPGYHASRDACLRERFGLTVVRFDDQEIAALVRVATYG